MNRSEQGFALLDSIIAVTVFSLTATGFASFMLSSKALEERSHDRAEATSLAREIMEQVRHTDFDQLWARYNDDPEDDPEGAGTAPGSTLERLRLYELLGDRVHHDGVAPPSERAQRTQVSIRFPADDEGRIREDLEDAGLGMPRDLNGDGVIDGEDHRDDALMLPVEIRVRFPTAGGAELVRLQTVVSRR